MSRVEPKNRQQDAPRKAGQPRQGRDPHTGHTPGSAEGEERTVDEALKREEKR